ncbi:MAG: hypothetical protein PHW04_15570 [Candidatus Wallbacteria bacterium]|nr:hypothetical protein [Candidatus Wallbacteria bacterium]
MTEDEITYRSLLIRTRRFFLSDIKKYKSLFAERTYSDRFKPFVRAEIKVYSKGVKPMYINLRVFDKDEMGEVFKILDKSVEENKKAKKRARALD